MTPEEFLQEHHTIPDIFDYIEKEARERASMLSIKEGMI